MKLGAGKKIKKWVLTPHAVRRMEERRITLADLEMLISDPDQVISQGPKWILAKSFTRRDDNALAAVLMEKQEKDLWVVITVMVQFEVRK